MLAVRLPLDPEAQRCTPAFPLTISAVTNSIRQWRVARGKWPVADDGRIFFLPPCHCSLWRRSSVPVPRPRDRRERGRTRAPLPLDG